MFFFVLKSSNMGFHTVVPASFQVLSYGVWQKLLHRRCRSKVEIGSGDPEETGQPSFRG